MKRDRWLDDLGDVFARAAQLSVVGSTIEKAVRYLNAEFPMCFYANKKTLWVTFKDDKGQQEYRAVGAFA